jgi:hypothetical protein
MNDFSPRMIEATRLTRAGRLTEAMEVLRGTLAGIPRPAPAADTGTAGQPTVIRRLLDKLGRLRIRPARAATSSMCRVATAGRRCRWS